MTFELVQKHSAFGGMSRIQDDEISTGKGSITFGRNMSDKLTKGNYIEIYVDKINRRLGFKQTTSQATGYKIQQYSTKSSLCLSVSLGETFMKKIPRNRYKVFEENGMFIAHIPDMVVVEDNTTVTV